MANIISAMASVNVNQRPRGHLQSPFKSLQFLKFGLLESGGAPRSAARSSFVFDPLFSSADSSLSLSSLSPFLAPAVLLRVSPQCPEIREGVDVGVGSVLGV